MKEEGYLTKFVDEEAEGVLPFLSFHFFLVIFFCELTADD